MVAVADPKAEEPAILHHIGAGSPAGAVRLYFPSSHDLVTVKPKLFCFRVDICPRMPWKSRREVMRLSARSGACMSFNYDVFQTKVTCLVRARAAHSRLAQLSLGWILHRYEPALSIV